MSTLLDSKYVDIKVAGGRIVVELPLVEVFAELAKQSDNTVDDALVELLRKALGEQPASE